MTTATSNKQISDATKQILVKFQRQELTDRLIYTNMAKMEKNLQNKAVLFRIAHDEAEHAAVWQRYSGLEAKPNILRVWLCTVLTFIFGYTFVIKVMEKGETSTALGYVPLIPDIPEAKNIVLQEEGHEKTLHDMLDEERLHYVGAMVLGLNDALVELTGTIAGLTFALADNRIVALAGIITGISATLSMAASNYLAERANNNPEAFKSCLYTGIAYLVTVVLLVLPYLLYPHDMYLSALVTMLAVVVFIIFFFNYYISVAKSLPFWRRFGEMAAISLGVAVISFVIGLVAKSVLGVEV